MVLWDTGHPEAQGGEEGCCLVSGKGVLRDLEMNRVDMAGVCLGVADSTGSAWDSGMGPFLDWPLLLESRQGLPGAAVVWWCLWTLSRVLPRGSVCQTCSDFSPVSCGSECASPVDRPGLHCGASLGASLRSSVSLQGPGLSGTGALVIMAILRPQQLVSHWCGGWEEPPSFLTFSKSQTIASRGTY